MGNNIETLIGQVRQCAGSGNTSYVMEAAKKNPHCRILCKNAIMAGILKDEYINWYIENYRESPSEDNVPVFVGLGMPLLGNNRPLIVDNSCIDSLDVENLKHENYQLGFNAAINQNKLAHVDRERRYKAVISEFQLKWYYKLLPSGVKLLIKDLWQVIS